MIWFCMDCDGRTEADRHGRCGKCDSNALLEMNPMGEEMTSRDAYLKLIKALDTRLPDTELLGEGTVEQLVRRRMSVLNATAQAMIEESGAEQLLRHKPRMPEGVGIPSYEQIRNCTCGLRYTEPMPAGHQRHVDKVLQAIILTIRDAVIKNKQINWHDVKEEADTWHNETSEPMPN